MIDRPNFVESSHNARLKEARRKAQIKANHRDWLWHQANSFHLNPRAGLPPMILIANLIAEDATLEMTCTVCGYKTIASGQFLLSKYGVTTDLKTLQRRLRCQNNPHSVKCGGLAELSVRFPDSEHGRDAEANVMKRARGANDGGAYRDEQEIGEEKMCNRYQYNFDFEEVQETARVIGTPFNVSPAIGNNPPRDVYPDQDAPVIVRTEDGLSLEQMRWGFPPVADKKPVITNIRNLQSRWWKDVNREWILEPQYRALVPFSRFAEPPRNPTWFTVPDRNMVYFAGVWRPWKGERLKVVSGEKRRKRVEDDWHLFSFLTTDANSIVRPVHEKAMPVILTTPEECAEWMGGGEDSLRLQRPLPDDLLVIEDSVQ